MKHILNVMTSCCWVKVQLKWRQRPDMTIAVDYDVKHQFKQTNKLKPNIWVGIRITFILGPPFLSL